MNSRHLTASLSTVLFGLFLSQSVAIHAQDHESSENPKGVLIFQPTQKGKRIPSYMRIGYEYKDNGILIFSEEWFSEIDITVTNISDSIEQTGHLSNQNGFFLYTGQLYGYYSITCITDSGSIFYGEIQI